MCAASFEVRALFSESVREYDSVNFNCVGVWLVIFGNCSLLLTFCVYASVNVIFCRYCLLWITFVLRVRLPIYLLSACVCLWNCVSECVCAVAILEIVTISVLFDDIFGLCVSVRVCVSVCVCSRCLSVCECVLERENACFIGDLLQICNALASVC